MSLRSSTRRAALNGLKVTSDDPYELNELLRRADCIGAGSKLEFQMEMDGRASRLEFARAIFSGRLPMRSGSHGSNPYAALAFTGIDSEVEKRKDELRRDFENFVERKQRQESLRLEQDRRRKEMFVRQPNLVPTPPSPGPPPAPAPLPAFALFLSHSWGPAKATHERVKRICRSLQQLHFSVFLDEDYMPGRMLDHAMSEGIDKSRIVLVFITQEYMDKVAGPNSADNCQKEFSYAVRRKQPANMIPVVLDGPLLDTARWHGPVGLNLAGSLYVNMVGSVDVAPLVHHLASIGVTP